MADARPEASSISLAPYDPEQELPDDAILRAADTLHSLLGSDARDKLIKRLLAARAAEMEHRGMGANVAADAHVPDDYQFDTALPVWPDDLLLPEVTAVEQGLNGVEMYVSVDRRHAVVRQEHNGGVAVAWGAEDDAGPEFTTEQLESVTAYLRALYDRADQLTVEVESFAFDSVRERIASMLDQG
ncbi:hypothetical protein ACFT2C_05905 [Promicromonospora sp. NPDC057138]|uniref:hypothetical protein n=1 Tax=Promicromonospora sp. NPDC057138 TaxID=3346031 RepID=UPI003644847D